MTVLLNIVNLTLFNTKEKVMPKVSRTPEEVLLVREKILTEAIHYIAQEGWPGLSMRKLAAKTGMTAANIYNYYGNKDELYLDIQTEGFKRLVHNFREIRNSSHPAPDQLREAVKCYIEFGTHYPNWYNIIFSMDTPKYADYVGTAIEPTAYEEKQEGLKLIAITIEIIHDIYDRHSLERDDAPFRAIQLWIELHGLVSLINSRVLQEVEGEYHSLTERLMENFYRSITTP